MMASLKPCPFGCTDVNDVRLTRDGHPDSNDESWVVECENCLARGPWASTRPKAAELWNKRGEI
jgi:Lar family restriction alleviation protein